MRIFNFLFALYFMSSCFCVFGQRADTIRFMQYNLLNYRNTTNQCNGQTNNPDKKDEAIKTIVAYAKPDVILVNEMGANWLNPNKLLSNALNKDSDIPYDQAEFSNNSFSEITNMLFFNSEKLAYHSQDLIQKALDGKELVRVIDVYRIYLKDNDALQKGDTLFFNVIGVHLKAGSTTADQTEREAMAEAIMNYMNAKRSDENYILCGDLNIQSSNEACYKTLTSEKPENIRFFDPVDAPGTWSGKSLYSNLHTQSTRATNTSGGCFSGGGLDDRFDFILVGKEVIDYSNMAGYISGSYTVLGQDSRRFNGNVINPTNNSVPLAVAQALYDASDHLPVLVDVEVSPVHAGVSKNQLLPQTVRFRTSGSVLTIWDTQSEPFGFRLLNMSAQGLAEGAALTQYELNLDGLPRGVYHLIIQNRNSVRAYRLILPN